MDFSYTIFGIPDIEGRNMGGGGGVSHRPTTKNFVRKWWFVLDISFNLMMFTFSGDLPTWRLIPDQWCSAGSAIVAFVVSVIVNVAMYLAVVLHRDTWLGTGFCHGWVEGKRASVFCRSVVNDGMESAREMKWICIFSQLRCTSGKATLAHRNQTRNGCRICRGGWG